MVRRGKSGPSEEVIPPQPSRGSSIHHHPIIIMGVKRRGCATEMAPSCSAKHTESSPPGTHDEHPPSYPRPAVHVSSPRRVSGRCWLRGPCHPPSIRHPSAIRQSVRPPPVRTTLTCPSRDEIKRGEGGKPVLIATPGALHLSARSNNYSIHHSRDKGGWPSS